MDAPLVRSSTRHLVRIIRRNTVHLPSSSHQHHLGYEMAGDSPQPDDAEPRRGGRARKAVERFEPNRGEGK
jgi:hypothetical protein